MNELDDRIQAALNAATDLSEPLPDPTFAEEILESFQGRYRLLMITSWIKMIAVAFLTAFFVFQFFQQETMMAMIAFASAAIMSVVSAACLVLFLWVQMNHNTTVREVKRLETQIALLIRQLKDKES